jgi:hypothetical protein
MATATSTPPATQSVFDEMKTNVREWARLKGPFWAASAGGHLLALALFGLVAGTIEPPKAEGMAPEFESVADTQLPEPDLTRFDIGDTSLEPTVLDTASLLEMEAPEIAREEQNNDESEIFTEAGGGFADPASPLNTGGLGGFTVTATGDGAAVKGAGGVGSGQGNSKNAGSGGGGHGFGGRGSGMQKAMAGAYGGTKQTDRAVAGTVNWLARHQNPDGSWSLEGYHKQCTPNDRSCYQGEAEDAEKVTFKSDPAATALALLPFLAAGQTHRTRGPYQKTIDKGLRWLVGNQRDDGYLAKEIGQPMYTHGLCAIVLCEAFGMSQDRELHNPAQYAIDFIAKTQNDAGGWRYNPGDLDADTSVVGWQLMALKSGQMAGLKVDPKVLDRAKGFLTTVARGESKGLFVYTPDQVNPNEVMTSVGLLCNQYMGMTRDEPAMVEGMKFLMDRLPNPQAVNSYYWYYATQVMHNLPGPEWDKWNREMRRALLDSQRKDGCAAGSWDPKPDQWGPTGGRVMTTAINSLCLEVYYRYIPLYKLDGGPDGMASQSKPIEGLTPSSSSN